MLCAGLGSNTATPVASNEEQIKISYLYNFAKFIKWPPVLASKKAGAHFTICTVGTSPLSPLLPVLENRLVNGRPVQILDQPIPSLGDNSCEILYIGASEHYSFPQLLKKIANSPTLTVSDIPGFNNEGGMIGLMVQDNRVRFAINLKAMRAAGLTADSQLLSLAVEVGQ